MVFLQILYKALLNVIQSSSLPMDKILLQMYMTPKIISSSPVLLLELQRLISKSQLNMYISIPTAPKSQSCPEMRTLPPVPDWLICKMLEMEPSPTYYLCWRLVIWLLLPFFKLSVSYPNIILTINFCLPHCPLLLKVPHPLCALLW